MLPSRSGDGAAETPMPPSRVASLMEEESEDAWLPLDGQGDQDTFPASSYTNSTAVNSDRRSASSARSSAKRSPPAPNSSARNISLMQRRLQTNFTLKNKLVDHPLSQFGAFFVQHFVSQLWELDLHVRFGVVLLLFGMALQVMDMLWRWCHPSTVFIVVLFGVSIVYLAPKDAERQWRSLLDLLTSSPVRWLDYLHQRQLRNIFIVSSLIPSLLELNTLGILSIIVVESGWSANLTVSCFIFFFMSFRTKYFHLTPRENHKQGVLLFYGFSLILAIYNYRFSVVAKVGGPFCLSTGTLLVSLGAWTTITRHALRLTLRDVLANVSQNVQQDEMLQLAMLRWLVDYWSNTANETRPTQQPQEHNGKTATSASIEFARPPGNSAESSTNNNRPVNNMSMPSAGQQTNEIPWNEMWTMLQMTTEQMEEETPTTESTSRPPPDYSKSGEETNHSLKNLNAMLASMDVDLHAKPAVEAYKNVVATVPPTPHTALLIAILRRCPATILLLCRYLNGSSLAFSSTLVLLPFVVTELYRVLGWAEACHRLTTDESQPESVDRSLQSMQNVANIAKSMDAMTILLSGDNYSPHRPSTILQVWFNVQESVTALEMGLIAARCAQTTAAAADFASHIISLADLGVEVSNHGWLHGLAILTQELVHMHSGGTQSRSTKYTSAAMGVLRNGNIVVKNVQILSDENNIHPVFDPVMGFFALVAGRGWAWGFEGPKVTTTSTVEIVEITEEEESGPIYTEELDAPTPARKQYDPSKKGNQSEMSAPEDNLSSLMELIADTYERGLISESEKASFIVMLSGRSKPSSNIIEGVRNSLHCAISNVEQPTHDETDEIIEAKVTSDVQSTTIDTDENYGVMSQCSSWEEMHDDNDSNIETLHIMPEVARNRQASESATRTSTRDTEDQPGQNEPTCTDDGGSELFKWVGGGLAVVGAVVGGVALLNSANRSGSNSMNKAKNDSGSQRQGEGDEPDETWVTVSSDYVS